MTSAKSEAELVAEYERELNDMQWYIVTAVTGKEDAVAKDIYDKLVGYNFKNHVSKIEVIKEERITKEIFSADDLPNTYNRKQKGVTWRTIELGNNKFKYEKTKVSLVNKYPGYIFINCIMDDEVWYVIRNTANVTGVVGSSGRGVKPIPISNEEFNRMKNNLNQPEADVSVVENHSQLAEGILTDTNLNDQAPAPEIKLSYSVGDIVEIEGVGEATVEKIDLDKHQVQVSIDMLGDVQTLTYDLDLVKDKA